MKLLKFPERRQTYTYDCWASAVQAVLHYYGIDIREDIVMKIAWTDKEWTSLWWIEKVIHTYWLETDIGGMTITKIKKYIDKDIPVIVALQARTQKKHVDWENNWSDWHYVVIIWYDKNKVYFEDPSSIFRTYLSLKEFKERWHDIDINKKKYINYWLAIYGKKPTYDVNTYIHMD